jgi:prophage tail gpP-like protein
MKARNDPDRIELTIGGVDVPLYQSYEIKVGVLTQPAAFSVKLGWGGAARDLLNSLHPGLEFVLKIDQTPIQSGLVESINVPGGGPTQLEINGRDHLCKMLKSHIESDKSFMRPTYYELVRAVMDECGMKEHKLHAGNGANLKSISKIDHVEPSLHNLDLAPFSRGLLAASSQEDLLVLSRETNVPVQGGGGGKVVYQALRAKLAGTWYDWLMNQLKLAGLFLWCGGDGTMIIAELSQKSAPIFQLIRQRGNDRNAVNVLSHSYRNATEDRHSKYIIHGRYGAGPGGRARFKGEWVDQEMVAWGFTSVYVEKDDDVKNKKEADYLARRRGAEARRGGRELTYTVRGHRIPENLAMFPGALWWPDTTADVKDDELGIYGTRYIESITFKRSEQTTTTLTLIDPEDLAFIAEAPR